jgi:DNA-binding NtrC family response regulator
MGGKVGKILVVEKDKDSRDLIVEFLSQSGFAVESESHSATALERVTSRGFDFLLVSDRIEGMETVDFVQKAVALSPDSFVIFASLHEKIGRQIRLFHDRFRRIPKPLVLSDLESLIRSNGSAGRQF